MRVCTELEWPGLGSPKWDGFSYSFVHLGAPTVRVFTCALWLRRADWTHYSVLFVLAHCGTVLRFVRLCSFRFL